MDPLRLQARTDPTRRIDERDAWLAFRAAVKELAARERAVLTLRYVEGLSVRQAAERLDATPKQVEHWSASAVGWLRFRMQGGSVVHGELHADAVRAELCDTRGRVPDRGFGDGLE